MRSYLSEYDGGPQLPFGANCAIRRERCLALGGFRPGLDRVGDSLVSNGETELFGRLRASGGSVHYAPSAVVTHRIPSQRLTRPWLRRRARAQGTSDTLTCGRPAIGRTLVLPLRFGG